MMTFRLALVAGGLLATTGVTIAAAQEDKMLRPPMQPEAIIYRDVGYNGPAVNISAEEPNLGLSFKVRSIRVRSGEWQLCERPNFRGNCRILSRDTPVISIAGGIVVQSVRPLGWSGPGGGSGGSGEPGNNPTLRGMAAQFYPAPALRGYRVEACEGASANSGCARRTAERFCSTMGWRTAVRQSMETVRRRVYLADVLCSNTGT